MLKIKGSAYILVCIFVILGSRPGYPQQQTTVTLTAYDIMRLVVGNMEKNELLKSKFVSFERRHIEHELYRNGGRKSILKNETSYHGESYPPESRGNSGGLSVNLSAILSLSYDYAFIDSNNSNYINLPPSYKLECGECYIIKFEPKRNQPDVAKIMTSDASAIEKGIHETAMRMEGIIFIDKLHLFVRKYAGELGSSFDKGRLSSVKITMASIDLEQELRSELSNVVVFKSAEIMYQVRIAWLSYRTRKDMWEWSNYHLNK